MFNSPNLQPLQDEIGIHLDSNISVLAQPLESLKKQLSLKHGSHQGLITSRRYGKDTTGGVRTPERYMYISQ